MTRLGIISDIHGNLVALEAVLAALKADDVERLICLGDVAATGPQPAAVIERVQALNCPVVRGNMDDWLLGLASGAAVEPHSATVTDIGRWALDQLSEAHLACLRSCQPTVSLPLTPNDQLIACHGSPRSNTEALHAFTTDQDLAEILAGLRATVVASGHTHVPMLRCFQATYLLNPGTVGRPFERVPASVRPRPRAAAEYAILTWDEAGLRIELRHTQLDAARVVEAAAASGMPHVEWWAADWLA